MERAVLPVWYMYIHSNGLNIVLPIFILLNWKFLQYSKKIFNSTANFSNKNWTKNLILFSNIYTVLPVNIFF